MLPLAQRHAESIASNMAGPCLVNHVIPPINVDRFPCDKLGHVHCEDGDGESDIIDRHETVKGSFRLGFGDEFVKIGDA